VFSSLNRCLDCYLVVVVAFFSSASEGTGGLMKVQGPMGPVVVALVIIGFMTRGRFRRDCWRTEPVNAGAPV
jgi:hypothetical protein